jgi:hypothetical protein
MAKWVYYTQEIYLEKLNDELDKAGEKEWELISLTLLPPPMGLTYSSPSVPRGLRKARDRRHSAVTLPSTQSKQDDVFR